MDCCDKSNLIIGADPEFSLLMKSGVIRSAGDVADGSHVGVDGGGVAAELRPAPSVNPIEVVRNIQMCLYKGLQKSPTLGEYIWKAGSYSGTPTGGHIHLGINAIGMTASVSEGLVHLLDHFLTIPASLLETGEALLGRRNAYGRLSDTRRPAHGLEYRSLGSWLTSPYVAASVLCIAKAITIEAHEFRRELLIPAWVRDAYSNLNRGNIKRWFNDVVIAYLKNLHMYTHYKQYIDFFISLVGSGKSWYPKCGMRKAWGLPSESEDFVVTKYSIFPPTPEDVISAIEEMA